MLITEGLYYDEQLLVRAVRYAEKQNDEHEKPGYHKEMLLDSIMRWFSNDYEDDPAAAALYHLIMLDTIENIGEDRAVLFFQEFGLDV